MLLQELLKYLTPFIILFFVLWLLSPGAGNSIVPGRRHFCRAVCPLLLLALACCVVLLFRNRRFAGLPRGLPDLDLLVAVLYGLTALMCLIIPVYIVIGWRTSRKWVVFNRISSDVVIFALREALKERGLTFTQKDSIFRSVFDLGSGRVVVDRNMIVTGPCFARFDMPDRGKEISRALVQQVTRILTQRGEYVRCFVPADDQP